MKETLALGYTSGLTFATKLSEHLNDGYEIVSSGCNTWDSTYRSQTYWWAILVRENNEELFD